MISYNQFLSEIRRRADPTDPDFYQFIYYGGNYFGANLNGQIFKGNFFQTLLDADRYLANNSLCALEPGYIEFIKLQYQIVCNSIYDNNDLDLMIATMEDNLFMNSILWVRSVDI